VEANFEVDDFFFSNFFTNSELANDPDLPLPRSLMKKVASER
jgi:hypothetical protein